MEVTGFLCVSLGSSTNQLLWQSRKKTFCACSEAGDCAWPSILRYAFLWMKGPMQRIFIKKCFLFMVASGCRVKRSTLHDQCSADDAEVETTIKRFLCCGFLCDGKAMGQVYRCWQKTCLEIFCPCSNKTHFTFYIPLWPILLTHPRIVLISDSDPVDIWTNHLLLMNKELYRYGSLIGLQPMP
jgi:hypothetical protein